MEKVFLLNQRYWSPFKKSRTCPTLQTGAPSKRRTGNRKRSASILWLFLFVVLNANDQEIRRHAGIIPDPKDFLTFLEF